LDLFPKDDQQEEKSNTDNVLTVADKSKSKGDFKYEDIYDKIIDK